MRASLRQLDGYEVENVRDQELLVPLRERALLPVLAGLTGPRPAVHARGLRRQRSSRSSSMQGGATRTPSIASSPSASSPSPPSR